MSIFRSTLQLNGYADGSRVEKYRPDTLDDVSGHQDILATINRFVDTNVRHLVQGVYTVLKKL